MPVHPYRAKLELGNFAEGIQGVVGEQVCGCLVVGEGHHDHALLHAFIDAGGYIQSAAP